MKKYISIIMAACLLFGSVCISAYADDHSDLPDYEFIAPMPKTEPCEHNCTEIIAYPTCEYDGCIDYICKKCGRNCDKKLPDECDKFTDWYELFRLSDYDAETECMKYSQIDIEKYAEKYPHEIFRDFLDSYYENYIVTDAEAEKEWLDENGNMKYSGSGIDTFTIEVDGVKLCLDDIRPKTSNYSAKEIKEKTLTYEISYTHAKDYPEDADAYHYMIRFNGCDLHALGHYKAEMTDNTKRDELGNVCYCEHVTYCILCGKEFSRTPDNTYYEQEVTQLPTTSVNGNDVQIMQPTVTPIRGDINYDLNVNAADAREVLRYSAGLSNTCYNLSMADYNEDGRVTALDARMILRVAAGLSAK